MKAPYAWNLLRAVAFAILLVQPARFAAAGAEAEPHDEHAGHEHAGEHRDEHHADEHGDKHGDERDDEHADGDEHADKHGVEHGEAHGEGHHDEVRKFTVEELQRSGVTLATAGPADVDVAVELPAEIRPNADRIAHIAPRFRGIVREARRSVGDQVSAGDVLAVIESENLSSFELRAAFAGTVIDKHIVAGEAASPENPAYIVADLSTVWVLVSAYPQALPLVRVGRPVRISADGGAEIESRVAYVSPVVEEETRMATARVVIPNADGRWRPGLFVTATIEDPVPAPVVVPRRSVQTFEGRSTVFVAAGSHFEPRAVELGRLGRSLVEVRSGLAAGERVAADRSFLVKAEMLKGEGGGHEH